MSIETCLHGYIGVFSSSGRQHVLHLREVPTNLEVHTFEFKSKNNIYMNKMGIRYHLVVSRPNFNVSCEKF